MKKIDVFLLAAGESSRMFPLSQIMEKSLLPVDGKPVIRHIIDNLRKCPMIGNITICCLEKYLKQFMHEFRGEHTYFQTFEKPLGTATTLNIVLKRQVESITNFVMVHYADCLTDIDYLDFITKTLRDKKSGDAVIAVTNTVKHDYSQVECNEQEYGSELENVTNFIEKPQLPDYTWSGIALIKPITVQALTYKENLDIAKDIFPPLVDKRLLKAYRYHGYWYDMGNLNSYRKICAQFNGEK